MMDLPFSDLAKYVLLIHVGTTLAMVGVIWFVQLAHYPLFAWVGSQQFANYEAENTRRTTWVVLPLMLAEVITAVLIPFYFCPPIRLVLAWFGLGCLAAIWLMTFFVHVPQHAKLTNAFDGVIHKQLVTSNWLRTIIWTIRGVLVLAMLV